MALSSIIITLWRLSALQPLLIDVVSARNYIALDFIPNLKETTLATLSHYLLWKHRDDHWRPSPTLMEDHVVAPHLLRRAFRLGIAVRT
ncbi:hypothetical protein BDQ17DRAFT_529369 [Cyathus striatus]|nr:hypothetical protein BDQ17DRAFT_529369 [Cyathus striatus]